ncbi:MAG: carbon storage regulator [Planctomycetes bacterium]|nr:carbon storage regulator [Planctomycetota bacterium]
MLVLSRRVGERIQIGPDIVVTVARLTGNSVRIAVEAPNSVKIVRSELAAGDPAHAAKFSPVSKPPH